MVQPQVRLRKGESRSRSRALGLPFNLGEMDIPRIIMKDKVLKLHWHMILKDQVSCLN